MNFKQAGADRLGVDRSIGQHRRNDHMYTAAVHVYQLAMQGNPEASNTYTIVLWSTIAIATS